MGDKLKKYAPHFQLILSLLIVFVTGYDMLGKPARLVLLLTLIIASISTGISIGILRALKLSNRLQDINNN